MLNAKYEDEERPAQPPPTLGHDDVTLYVDCTDVDEAYAKSSQVRDRTRRLHSAKLP